MIYRSAAVYDLLMRVLYGRHHRARSRVLADLIPQGASVLDLCCGPGFLYERHLRARGVTYLGLDLNPRFVARVRRLGGEGRVCDLREPGDLPKADVVVMQSSLYHFLPDVDPVLDRMERAARRLVIVAEPIRNAASSRNPLLAALARWQTDPGVGAQAKRFDEAMLDRVLGTRPCRARRSFTIPGGREKVFVLEVGTPDAVDPGTQVAL